MQYSQHQLTSEPALQAWLTRNGMTLEKLEDAATTVED